MSKNVLSFVLFGDKSRYWSVIPISLISHRMAFPKFKIRIYISSEVYDNRLFPLLRELKKTYGLIEIKHVNCTYRRTQPTLWRMKPLWDKKVKYVFCRDLDAVCSRNEIQAMKMFMSTNLWIHGIRSYRLHTINLMAGMCGFNAEELRKHSIMTNTFLDYQNAVKSVVDGYQWGCDQFALRYFFYVQHSKKNTLMRKTLDTVLGDAPKHLGHFKAVQLGKNSYKKISLSYISHPKIFDIAKKLQPFASAPIMQRDSIPYLNRVLRMNTDMSSAINKIFNKYPQIRKYYLRN